MEQKPKYKINVRTLSGEFLTFKVVKYEIKDGFVTFIDKFTKKQKRFNSLYCEIDSLEGEDGN